MHRYSTFILGLIIFLFLVTTYYFYHKDLREEYELSLVITGDALIHANIYKAAKTDHGYDFNPMLKHVKPIINKYDLAFYNQESIFAGTNIDYSDYPNFNTPSQFGDAMINVGFNIVALANNHALDKGEQGIIKAVDYWGKTNVLWQGINNSFEAQAKIPIMKKNNITYALLAYTTFSNRSIASKEYLVNYYSYDRAKKDVESIRNKVDVIIVSIHWGTEYTQTVSKEQEQIAKELASLKANIVIGHHPHILQPITKIDDTIIMYSLGNFISDQDGTSKQTGALVAIDIKKTIKNNRSQILLSAPTVELIYTYKDSKRKTFLVIPFSQIDYQYLKNINKVYQDQVEILTLLNKDIKFVPIKEP